METPLENKVAKSGLVVLDLEEWAPKEQEMVLLDIQPWLFEGLVLKEKNFRAYVKAHDWTKYSGKNVAITCSTDAIIPLWAYMLIASKLSPYVDSMIFGNMQDLEKTVWRKIIDGINVQQFKDKRVIIKGCSNNVPHDAYVYLTQKLMPVVLSLMFGEPCSTVPIYKKKKA